MQTDWSRRAKSCRSNTTRMRPGFHVPVSFASLLLTVVLVILWTPRRVREISDICRMDSKKYIRLQRERHARKIYVT